MRLMKQWFPWKRNFPRNPVLVGEGWSLVPFRGGIYLLSPRKKEIAYSSGTCQMMLHEKMQPSQWWISDEWDNNTSWLGLFLVLHTSGPLLKTKAHTKTQGQTQEKSLDLFVPASNVATLKNLLLLLIVTCLLNLSFVCFFGRWGNLGYYSCQGWGSGPNDSRNNTTEKVGTRGV